MREEGFAWPGLGRPDLTLPEGRRGPLWTALAALTLAQAPK